GTLVSPVCRGGLVQRGLGGIADSGRIPTAVAELGDAAGGRDQPPQQCLFRDDLCVVAGVERGGHGGDQRVQVGGTADAFQLAATLQLGGDGDRIDRLAPPVQVEDGLVDGLVSGPVEVVGP